MELPLFQRERDQESPHEEEDAGVHICSSNGFALHRTQEGKQNQRQQGRGWYRQRFGDPPDRNQERCGGGAGDRGILRIEFNYKYKQQKESRSKDQSNLLSQAVTGFILIIRYLTIPPFVITRRIVFFPQLLPEKAAFPPLLLQGGVRGGSSFNTHQPSLS